MRIFVYSVITLTFSLCVSAKGATPEEIESFILANEGYAESVKEYEYDFTEKVTETLIFGPGEAGTEITISRAGTISKQTIGTRCTTDYQNDDKTTGKSIKQSVVVLNNDEYLFYRQNQIGLSKQFNHDSQDESFPEADAVKKSYLPKGVAYCTYVLGFHEDLRKFLEKCKPAWKDAVIIRKENYIELRMLYKETTVVRIVLDMNAGGPIIEYEDMDMSTQSKLNHVTMLMKHDESSKIWYPTVVTHLRTGPDKDPSKFANLTYRCTLANFVVPRHEKKYFFIEGLDVFSNSGSETLLEIAKGKEPIVRKYIGGDWRNEPTAAVERGKKSVAGKAANSGENIMLVSGIALVIVGIAIAFRRGLSRT